MSAHAGLSFEAMLRDVGLRVTKPRLAVLSALQQHPHADTGAIIDTLRSGPAEVSHQAVYDCLSALTEAGIVRRIQPAGSTARYELRTGDNHHHLVCTRCGTVADVDCAVGDTPCLTAAEGHGFTIALAEVTYWGVCRDCSARKS